MDNCYSFFYFIRTLLLLLTSMWLHLQFETNPNHIETYKRRPVNGGNKKLHHDATHLLHYYICFSNLAEVNSPFPIKFAVSIIFFSSSLRVYENDAAQNAEKGIKRKAFSVIRLVPWEHCAVSQNTLLPWVEHPYFTRTCVLLKTIQQPKHNYLA